MKLHPPHRPHAARAFAGIPHQRRRQMLAQRLHVLEVLRRPQPLAGQRLAYLLQPVDDGIQQLLEPRRVRLRQLLQKCRIGQRIAGKVAQQFLLRRWPVVRVFPRLQQRVQLRLVFREIPVMAPRPCRQPAVQVRPVAL